MTETIILGAFVRVEGGNMMLQDFKGSMTMEKEKSNEIVLHAINNCERYPKLIKSIVPALFSFEAANFVEFIQHAIKRRNEWEKYSQEHDNLQSMVLTLDRIYQSKKNAECDQYVAPDTKFLIETRELLKISVFDYLMLSGLGHQPGSNYWAIQKELDKIDRMLGKKIK